VRELKIKNIFIYGNCQVKSLVPCFQILLAGSFQVSGIWDFHPESKKLLNNAIKGNPDLIITNLDIEIVKNAGWDGQILKIPSIYFGGFHPDTIYFRKDNGQTPMFFKNNASISAIALWSVKNGLSVQEALQLYQEEVFHDLGYFDYFDVCLEALAFDFERHKISTNAVYKFICSRSIFMWGPLHPKIKIMMTLASEVCASLSLKVTQNPEALGELMPDPLQQEYAWGVYPPIADRLGVPGTWSVRHHSQIFLTTESYLNAIYNEFNDNSLQDIDFSPEDKFRFSKLTHIDRVLSRPLK